MRKAELIFQNNLNGEVWELSEVATSISFKTKRRGEPSSIEIEVVTTLDFPYGSSLAVKIDEVKLFYGFLFKVKKGKQNKRTLVFFDQLKYLLRSNTYVFKDLNLNQVISAIAKDFQLKTGALNAPTTKLPTILKEDKSALDAIQECMDEVLTRTGRLCVFWDEFGSLRIDEPKNLMIQTVLADASIISDFEWEGSIEDSANIVKLVHDNKKTGRREVYIYQDTNNIKKWGKLQFFKKMDENANEAQIKQMGEMYIKLKNRPTESVSLSFSVGDLSFRAGKAVYVDVREIGLSGWYVLEEVEHVFKGSSHTMEVKLFVQGGAG